MFSSGEGKGVQLLQPSSLGLENSSGSCFAQTTCFILFQFSLTRLTASAEKLIIGVGAENLVFRAEPAIRK